MSPINSYFVRSGPRQRLTGYSAMERGFERILPTQYALRIHLVDPPLIIAAPEKARVTITEARN